MRLKWDLTMNEACAGRNGSTDRQPLVNAEQLEGWGGKRKEGGPGPGPTGSRGPGPGTEHFWKNTLENILEVLTQQLCTLL